MIIVFSWLFSYWYYIIWNVFYVTGVVPSLAFYEDSSWPISKGGGVASFALVGTLSLGHADQLSYLLCLKLFKIRETRRERMSYKRMSRERERDTQREREGEGGRSGSHFFSVLIFQEIQNKIRGELAFRNLNIH